MDHYVSYSDESGVGGERYTSIASLSFRYSEYEVIVERLNNLLAESNVSEFKWQKLKNAKYRHCAVKLIDFIWELLGMADARLDVIIWDNQDSRHTVFGRDNTANFGRMFFHLQSASLKRRPTNSIWHLFPDQKVEIDWGIVTSCIESVGRRRQFVDEPLLGSFFTDPHYSVHECKEVESHVELPCQIADLFAGLAIFSKTHYGKYEQWREDQAPTLGLWENKKASLSNGESNRCEVLDYFNNGCKRRRLGVSLKTNRCLQTPRPSNPLNFWHYEPQHENDKAPIKQQ